MQKTQIYRVSVTAGISPVVYKLKVLGFIKANNKEDALSQVCKQFSEYPQYRILVETKTEVTAKVWDIEESMFPMILNDL